MPLKAKLKGCEIFSFNFDDDSWASLKLESVHMHCCLGKAVLKTSSLGTRFFSHYKKGDCASAGESAEHIYLKNLISMVALDLGWKVETEKQGITPNGEVWIADVYCIKGGAKLVFEVQWSYQAREDFLKRQEKYISSGVRAAWLYKLKSNKEYWIDDIPYQFETPVFGMKLKSKEIESLYVPQFNTPIKLFIEGMLQGKLAWKPKIGERLVAEVIPHFEQCWKCKRETGVILGVKIRDPLNVEIGFKKFSDEGVPEFLLENGLSDHLSKSKIGKIKNRFSNTRKESYISNGCYYCDALMGNFFIFESLVEYSETLPAPIFRFEFYFGQRGPYISSEWYFNGQGSNHIF